MNNSSDATTRTDTEAMQYKRYIIPVPCGCANQTSQGGTTSNGTAGCGRCGRCGGRGHTCIRLTEHYA